MVKLNERQIQIFLYIYNKNDWTTSEELANYFNLNKKTVQQEIKDISKTLSQGIVIEVNKHKGYRLDKISQETKDLLNEEDYLSEGKNSLTFIGSKIIIILLFYKDYVTMQELADSLYMSKTAISLDIDIIKRWIKRYKGLKLEVNRQKGIKIHGNELQKRVYCAIHITRPVFKDIPFLEDMKREYLIYYDLVEKILINTCLENNYIITGEDLKKSAKFITVSLIRSKIGYHRSSAVTGTDHNHFASKVVEEIQKTIDYRFNATEVNDIELLFVQSNTMTPSMNLETKYETRTKLKTFLEEVSDLIAIDIDLQTVDVSLLEDYINRKVLREEFGNIVVNHYNEEIFIEYPLEAYLVQRLISKYFSLEYSKELTYFSLFLTNIIDQNKKQSILLVCDQSVNTIHYLKNYLINHFSYAVKDITVVPTYQYYNMKQSEREYNILLTTNQKVLLNESDFFLIAPILNKSDKGNIEIFIKQKLLELKEKTQKDIFAHYYSVTDITPEDKVYQELRETLSERKANEEVLQTLSKTNLFKCSITHSGKSKITIYNLNKPILFDYKKISRIIEVNYNKSEEGINILPFFEAVSDILSLYK